MSSRPSRALRPETEVCQTATGKLSPNPNWARAGKRIHREVYPGYARLLIRRGATEEDEKHLLLFQVIAILFFDRECAGQFADMSRPYKPLLITHPLSPPENDLAVFGGAGPTLPPGPCMPYCDIEMPLPALPTTYDLRLIVEYLLCLDYKVAPPPLGSVKPASLESFARMSKRLYDFVWRCEECRPREEGEEEENGGSGANRPSLRHPSTVQVRAADAAAQMVRKAAHRMGLNYTDLALVCFHFYRLSWATLHLQADTAGTAAADFRAYGFGEDTFGQGVGKVMLEGDGWNRDGYSNSNNNKDATAAIGDASEGKSKPRKPLVFGRGHGAWGWGFDTYKGFRQSLPHPLIYGRWQGSLPTGVRDRILRKTSVDLNDLIPAVVFDRQRAAALTAAANDLAAMHGITRLSFDRAYPQPPDPEPFLAMGGGLGEAVSTLTDNVVGAAIGVLERLGGQAAEAASNLCSRDANVAGAKSVLAAQLRVADKTCDRVAAAAASSSCDWEVLEEDLPHGRDDDHEADDDVPEGWEMI
ncbi:hypothetical protein MAPG_08559 [Magnaporthiopsis poae ATCC 64411]|uniref:Uncharacterized protein n=1 Tax=Magnaporthiopsis poae (strain ATCC 64411 / 73-15) TaxID=644358 RepID=A0A0C4E7P3_MAGP6|nr:hypothetical protein MAPG_08559 [Magnaporthiopsis poae ATCC 64411]